MGRFLTGSAVAAVTVSPAFYQAAKAMVEVAENRDAGGLGGRAILWVDHAVFGDFLVWVWLGCVLLLLPGLLAKLSPEFFSRSDGSRWRFDRSMRVRGVQGAVAIGAAGLIAAWGAGHALRLPVRALLLGSAGVLLVEWMIRGVFFDLVSRAHSPRVAVVASALVFTVIASLVFPPATCVADGESWWLGWQWVGQLMARGGVDVAGWFALGLLLGWVRAGTGSIWPGAVVHLAWSGLLAATAQPSSGGVAWAALSAGFLWWIIIRSCHVRMGSR